MDLKLLLMRKGLKQLQVAKLIGVNHTVLNLQLNKHRILPAKYRSKFCEILGITEVELESAMKEKGGENE